VEREPHHGPNDVNMAAPRRLVVTGATGKQGGALIAALLARPSQPFEIYALTRNKTSRSARALASKPNVHVIEGHFKDPAAIFQQVENPWGMFLMTMPMNAKKEEAEGKAMSQAALDAGVQHIVFTATDRGGQEQSDHDPTPIPHFYSKYRIEKEIEQKAKAKGTTWTFLRPVAFFENMPNNFIGRAFVTIWQQNGLDRKLQFISTTDIGKVAADAFLNSESAEYRNKAVSLAGDDLSLDEAAKVFKEVAGQGLPRTYSFVGWLLKIVLWEQLGIMFKWFIDSGFKVDVPALRKRYPFLKDYRAWLREESAWKEGGVKRD
jgi:uncharacterized protein YbjT (DUF2867 family)